MAFAHKPGTDAIFKNDKKSKDHQPDYKGSLCLPDGSTDPDRRLDHPRPERQVPVPQGPNAAAGAIRGPHLMARYDRTCGRLRVAVNVSGVLDHTYGHGALIECPDGWNDSVPTLRLTVSVEELRDLRHLLDRAIAAATGDA